jgi:hypothetical protein
MRAGLNSYLLTSSPLLTALHPGMDYRLPVSVDSGAYNAYLVLQQPGATVGGGTIASKV